MSRNEIFDYLDSREDLVDPLFERLADDRRIRAVECDGFWASLDTPKDIQTLQELK